MPTKIIKGKYWDKSWNPIEVKGGGWHCTKVSTGCLHCWAEQQNLRFGNKLPYDNCEVKFVLNEKILQQPLRRKSPTTYFVCDLCDLFHKAVPFEFIAKVWDIMFECHQHTFLILTKRIKRAAEFCKWLDKKKYRVVAHFNIHLGVSISTQAEADEKIPILLQIPGKLWLSIEPLLEPIDYLTSWLVGCSNKHLRPRSIEMRLAKRDKNLRSIGHVVIGCESINGRAGRFRGGFNDAAINLVGQCKAAGLPVFVKQVPVNGKVSKNMAEWPEELQIQQFIERKNESLHEMPKT